MLLSIHPATCFQLLIALPGQEKPNQLGGRIWNRTPSSEGKARVLISLPICLPAMRLLGPQRPIISKAVLFLYNLQPSPARTPAWSLVQLG